ncbi:uncharacterized protein LOC128501175 [Spea bombifrons]|uniref:uncharacterized protein LOC128501175 n=1 Tax=Spea bombifrons TaxID=233779 RepID=UPI00234AE139|nr:uncharacterized protein LOC128501175 [Spea bombifrons]
MENNWILFFILLPLTLCGSQTVVSAVTPTPVSTETLEETTEEPPSHVPNTIPSKTDAKNRPVAQTLGGPPSMDPGENESTSTPLSFIQVRDNFTDDGLSSNTSLATTSEDPAATGHPDEKMTTNMSSPSSHHPSYTSTTTRDQTKDFDISKDLEGEGTTVVGHSTSPSGKNPGKAKLGYVVLAVILLLALLFLVMVVMLVRKKRRSGSRNFSKRSRKANEKNVWVGQVPELAEGGPNMGNGAMENGSFVAVTLMDGDQEMTTFGEKGDKVEEMDELEAGEKEPADEKEGKGKSGASEEKKPLLEEDSDGATDPGATEEQFPLPPPEQELTGNGGETL